MTSQPPPDLISLDQLSHLFNRHAAIGLNVKGNTQLESLACKHQSFSMSCSCSCQGKIVSTTFASWRDYGRVVGAPWSCLQNQNPGRIQTQPGNYPNDFRRSKNWGWGCLSGWGNWGYKATNTSEVHQPCAPFDSGNVLLCPWHPMTESWIQIQIFTARKLMCCKSSRDVWTQLCSWRDPWGGKYPKPELSKSWIWGIQKV